MVDTNATTPAPRRRRSWLRILGWIVGILIVLVIVFYFVATSSAFLRGAILPRVSKAVGADVTVSDATISPFSQVILHNLRVQAAGQEPLVTAPEVRLRYSLMDIIKGNIHVNEVTVVSPTVLLVTNAVDGTSNYGPILKAQEEQAKAQPKAEKPAQPAQPAKPSKPMQLDIRTVALTNGTVRIVELYGGGKSNLTKIAHLNVNLNDLKNGQTGKLVLGADLTMQNNPPAPATNGLLQARLDGNFNLTPTADLKAAAVQGNSKLQVTRAEGALAQAAQFAGTLNCDVTPTDIKEVALRFLKGSTALGLVRLSGPFDQQKLEGLLALDLLNIDKNLLNLVGASSGLDFGPTTINSTNQIQLSKGGALINAAGRFNLDQLQVTRTNQTTPPLDLHANYDVTVDRSASNAVLRVLNLNGAQKGNTFLQGGLTSPMTISFGGATEKVSDSALNITITNFNLADWNVFLGDVAPAGLVNSQFKLLSQQAGKLLTFELNSRIDNLTAGSGSNQITQATVTLQMNGKATDLKQFNLPAYKLEVSRQNQPLVTASGSATYDQASQNADVRLTAQVLLARLLQALPRPDINVSSGTAEANLHIVQTAQTAPAPNSKGQSTNVTQAITGSFTLSNLTGQVGSNVFRSFGTVADLDVLKTPQQVEIRKVSGRLLQGESVGGTFTLNGTYVLTNNAAHLTAQLADFNQAGLGTFLQPMLGDKQLVSVALNGNASVQYDPQAASSITGELQVTNLVVKDPSGQVPATPLEARAQIDAGLAKQVVTLRQVMLALTPTARATNQVQLTGQVDMSQTNAIQGNLKLAADSLDFTTYYDLFAGQKSTAKPASSTAPAGKPAAPSAPAAPAPEQEPEAKQFPVRNFTFETSIRRIYLHEVEMADVQNTTRIDGGHIVLNPCKLTLNGAPVTALVDADLGVPGYKYNVSFNAQAIPLAPLVNSFQPDRKGILSGTLTAQSQINGAGITGASLKKNLNGQFDFNSTNLNLSIDNIQGTTTGTKLLKLVLNTIAVIPELVKNPTGTGASLVSGLFGGGGSTTGTATTGGLAADLKKSPINSIIMRGNAGSGTVQLQQALVQSPAFEAGVSSGTVTLANVLTNSTLQIPVSISLERSIAQRIHLAGNTPTNATYAQLPQFLTITGTLGDPQRKIDYMTLATTAAQGVGGTAGQVGSALQGLKGMFGGGSSTNAPATGTNQPAKGGGLLQGLGKALGGTTSTNAPATNQSPVNNLLNRFLK